MMEPMDIVGKAKEDASLPKATMTKIIKEMLPPDVRVARDAQDLLIECCVEFINLVSSESNDVCNREEKRTIAPEHVLKALEGVSLRITLPVAMDYLQYLLNLEFSSVARVIHSLEFWRSSQFAAICSS
ncbi:protein Dr1 homolog isoform X3 [Spinacia oleracea]|uniref:Protein Dr1 homolog isoform X3 n=1 Tax=Spinacia oleracea TaxID=3562 RepID=A0ABM3RPV6_SPIOL|nr:protein Dr1 homolog isoform X3 [Spinacia oleracea]